MLMTKLPAMSTDSGKMGSGTPTPSSANDYSQEFTRTRKLGASYARSALKQPFQNLAPVKMCLLRCEPSPLWLENENCAAVWGSLLKETQKHGRPPASSTHPTSSRGRYSGTPVGVPEPWSVGRGGGGTEERTRNKSAQGVWSLSRS